MKTFLLSFKFDQNPKYTRGFDVDESKQYKLIFANTFEEAEDKLYESSLKEICDVKNETIL